MDAHGPILAAPARKLAVGILSELHGRSCGRTLPADAPPDPGGTCCGNDMPVIRPKGILFPETGISVDLICQCFLEQQTGSRHKKSLLGAPAQKHP